MPEKKEEVRPVKCVLSTWMGERRLKVADVARGTGLHRNVVARYYKDSVRQYDRDVLTALCDFFDREPGDLLVRGPAAAKKKRRPAVGLATARTA